MLLCYTKKHFCNKILAATCNTYWVRFAIRHHGFMCSDLHRTVDSLTLASAALATKFSNSWNHIACERVHGTFRAMTQQHSAFQQASFDMTPSLLVSMAWRMLHQKRQAA